MAQPMLAYLTALCSGDGGEAEVPPTSTQPVADADVSAQLAKRAQSRRHIHSYEVRVPPTLLLGVALETEYSIWS
jgi:hypothetical protein